MQRPASVVKELVENSLDAGADQISVEIEKGGKRLIRVSDNGRGLSRDDALLSIERYATSKIFSKEDLFSIATFGFRGEALPSIASVSKFTLVSRTAEMAGGTRIEVSGGKLFKVSDTGAPQGTMVEVRQLFFNTPARRKFLKTDNTESSHISDAVAGLAMGNPKVGFRLFVNGKLVRHFPKKQDTLQRAGMLLGQDAASQLYPLSLVREFNGGTLAISGVCANPSVTRSTAGRIYYFVNSRLVKDPGLTAALFQGYRGRIMKGRYPVGVICIDMPFKDVDVNVHPAKREIKFLAPQPVYHALAEAVSKAMAQAQTSPLAYARSGPQPLPVSKPLPFSPGPEDKTKEERSVHRPLVNSESSVYPVADHGGGGRGESGADTGYAEVREVPSHVASPRPSRFKAQGAPAEESTPKEEEGFKTDPAESQVSSGEGPLIRFRTLPRVAGQVLGTYIVAEHENHLLLIDQHAAHERITYERLKKRHQDIGIQSQDLMVPEVLELTHREADLLETIREDLAQLGVRIEPFGGTSFVIKAIPVLMEDRAVKPFVSDLIDALAQSNEMGEKDGWLDDVLITMSCHRAIRANKAMKPEEMEKLLEDLWGCENPMHCPHGRPILVSFDPGQLEKLFKRVV